MRARLAGAVVLALALVGCASAAASPSPRSVAERRVEVVATTNLAADLVRQVGGGRVEVTALMGPGVDPHLYKASAGDVAALAGADLVVYGGLHLEGRMADLFEELADTRATVALASGVPADRLLHDGDQADPHIWFDVTNWIAATGAVTEALAEVDPASAGRYRRQADAYAAELARLDRWVVRSLALVPPARRVLVTSHDAFGYFGRRYGVEVVAVQGVSTVAEATTADIGRVADLVAARGVPAVFLESSVPPQTLAAVQAAAAASGAAVEDGGELYADALGDEGTPEGTYVGMVRHNVTSIVEELR